MELGARFILNAFCSAFLTYLVTFGLVLALRPLIKSFRAIYFLYLLPLAKVVWDLIKNSHSNWAFLHGEGVTIPDTRSLSAYFGTKSPLAAVKLHLNEGYTFSLGDMIAETLGLAFLYTLASLVLILTIFSVGKALIKLHSTLKWQRKLPLIPISPFMATTNLSLKSPLLIGVFRPCIVIPKHLLATYDRQELEAVCSHEKNHILWQDNGASIVIEFLAALFWFLPFKRWSLKRAFFYRELSCDQACSPLPLATALIKTSSYSPRFGTLAFSSIHRTSEALFGARPGKMAKILSFVILLGGGAALFTCSFLPF